MFKAAGSGEIVRSHQKDDYYLNYLRGLVTDVVHQFVGPRFWIYWRKEIDVFADLGYFLLTTFSGYQTIGEEYVNIIQVDGTRRRVPSTLRRGLMVLLYIITPYLLRRLFEWLDKTLRSPDSQEIPVETREFLLKSIPVAKTVVLYCHRLHMAVFYLQGLFYQIAKRISGVSYIQQDFSMGKGDDSVTHSFKVLGWITLSQLIGSSAIGVYRFWREKSNMAVSSLLQTDKSESSTSYVSADRKCSLCLEERKHSSVTPCGHLFCWSCIHDWCSNKGLFGKGESSTSYVSADRKCSLCLEERKHSSVTPCGHLFCWSCIHDWCSNKAECPLCREKFEQHRIVPLQNFDPH